jgi:hypothetical protein
MQQIALRPFMAGQWSKPPAAVKSRTAASPAFVVPEFARIGRRF